MSTPRQPSYRLHKASGQAIVTIAGKDFYLGKYGTPESRAEYDRLIMLWLANGRQPVTQPAPDLTVAELLAGYWQHCQAGPNPHRVKSALAPANHLYGSTPARDFNGPALKACRQWLVEKGHCRKYVNQLTDSLRRAFAWAVGEDLIPPEVVTKLQAVEGLRAGRTTARESDPVRPVPIEHVLAAQACMSPQVAAMVGLQLHTGARPGEIAILRPCDVDRSGEVWRYTPARHKGQHRGKARTIWLGPRAQAVLLPWLDRLPGDYCFDPGEVVMARRLALGQRTTPVQAGPYLVTSYSRAVRKACVRAGVPHWHLHQLRHSAATLLVCEFGWDTARIILGHSTVGTTRLYADDAAEKAREAMRKAG